MKEIIKKIKKAKNIALFSHINADPDSLGSLAAMQHALSQMKKKSTIFLNEPLFQEFEFLSFENISFEQKGDFDLFISLDTSSKTRLGIFEKWFTSQKNSIAIDHHKQREQFAKIELIKTEKVSNCEILFELFKKLKIKWTKNICNALYTGICGDSGGFRFLNTTKKTYEYAGFLIEKGADFVFINELLFMTHELSQLKLMKILISKIEIIENIGISSILLSDKQEANCENYDTSEFINIVKSVKGVDLAVLFKQVKGNSFSVSFRSCPNYDVSLLAGIFGGGGHKCASGMSIMGTFQSVKKKVLKEVIKFVKEN